ncbi:MAG: hypothetical protein WBC80_21760, partial [Isosphaeraceae bacterium]
MTHAICISALGTGPAAGSSDPGGELPPLAENHRLVHVPPPPAVAHSRQPRARVAAVPDGSGAGRHGAGFEDQIP